MKANDLIDALTGVVVAGQEGRDIHYPEWLKIRRAIYKILGQAGDEARCVHPEPLYDGIVCITCGRKPNARNTLPVPPEAA
jgi:hypothetical protein